MTENDICGYEGTTTGKPCQHPAGSCPVPSHSDPEADNPQGRPSTLDDHWDDIMAGARQGMTLEGCARLAGVAEKTLHEWKNEHEDFRKSLRRARAQGELQHLQSVNDSGSRFVLERSFGYTKTEKREITGEGGGPLMILETDGDSTE